MSKIVIDARTLRDGSTGRYVERLLYYLQKKDKANDYVVLLKPADFDTWQPDNRRFVKVTCPYREYTLAEQFGFLKQLIGLKPNLVHFIMTHQPIFYFGKAVTTVHDLTTARFDNPAKNRLAYAAKQQVYKLVIKWVAHKSKRLITPSQWVKYDLANFAGVKADKITVTYEAADKITDKPEPIAKLKGKSFILYVGRPMPHKNLDRLVLAFGKLQRTHPKLHLALTGKTDQNYKLLKAYATEHQIKNVVFTDYIPEAQLRWLYENAKVYVFASLSEGFGLPSLEAMQYGLPVVSSRASCLPEVNKNAAHYFDPLDVDDMVAKTGQVLDSPTLAKSLATNGHRVVKQYSWAKTADQTLDVYKQVLGS